MHRFDEKIAYRLSILLPRCVVLHKNWLNGRYSSGLASGKNRYAIRLSISIMHLDEIRLFFYLSNVKSCSEFIIQ